MAITFKEVCRCTSPEFTAPTRMSVRPEPPYATTFLFPFPPDARTGARQAVVGLSDGSLLLWMLRDTTRTPDKPIVFKEHGGAVRCMAWAAEFGSGLLFTGSADRTIRLWDISDEPAQQGLPSNCVSTLHGHGGTVLSLCYGQEMLLSSSTDGTIGVWRRDPVRALLRYPAFVLRQKITAGEGPKDFRPGGSSRVSSQGCWANSISIREGESLSVFAGDSEGSLSVYKPEKRAPGEGEKRGPGNLKVEKRSKVHDNGVLLLAALPLESYLFTAAYDGRLKAFDALSAQPIFEQTNPSHQPFTALAWDSSNQDLLVGDAQGAVRVFNLYTESCIEHDQLCNEKIVGLHLETSSKLWVLTAHAVRLFSVTRSVRYATANEHTGPIVGLCGRQTKMGGLLYTASADMTIRWWDVDKDNVKEIKVLNEERSEPTSICCVRLPTTNVLRAGHVLCTGHEDGSLKLWSLDYESSAEMLGPGGERVHTNSVSCLCVAPLRADQMGDGKGGSAIVIAGGFDCKLSIWKVVQAADGTTVAKLEQSFRAHMDDDDEVLCLAHSTYIGCFFSAGNSGEINRWSLDSTAKQDVYKGHTDAVNGLAIDQVFLYSCSADQSVKVWETKAGYMLHSVDDLHSTPILAIGILPLSGTVVTCGDGKVVYFDPRKNEVIGTFSQPNEFCALTVAEKQKTVIVGSTEGPVVVFPFPESVAAAASLDSDYEDFGTDIDEANNQESLQTLDRIFNNTGKKRGGKKKEEEANEDED
jgi:WD40 repeat protein